MRRNRTFSMPQDKMRKKRILESNTTSMAKAKYLKSGFRDSLTNKNKSGRNWKNIALKERNSVPLSAKTDNFSKRKELNSELNKIKDLEKLLKQKMISKTRKSSKKIKK